MKVYSTKFIEDCRKRLEMNTVVISDAKTNIIEISVTDRSPTRASQIANAYVTELNAVLAAVNTSTAHRERLFLEARLDEVHQKSEADAREFAQFASQNGAIDIPEQAKSMVAAGAELESELIAAQAELKGLQQIYASNNARVRAARARVQELQSQVNKFGGKNVNPATDTSLAQDQLYPSVRQLPLLGVKYLDLYRRSKVDEVVFELLTREYEVAKIQEARETPTAQVLDPALVPSRKSSPHRVIITLCGTIAAFLCSSIYVIGWFAWEQTDSADPRKRLIRTVFASIDARIGRVAPLRTLSRRLTRTLELREQHPVYPDSPSTDRQRHARTRESA
jgi:uncharacterized protein involved in exopolysaccharide biosynthesis